ncbi:HAD family hydrolase [Paenibacillus qinlingensis]|uniref:2-haloacid dehalogenase/putative hydrolase of the HAD superfamily n=1 Tax=Paenibacillus qinlingensis TaxID=1837343 RepID=A0ABU1NYP3_9BACL|nr:HAD family hydrolase [Paenibacillus qinlingensis]MDR6552626.1 2-haloacid dehalogenase/putative hydrolase of the HAD superfamily [Paenibacillus qinlingensis]
MYKAVFLDFYGTLVHEDDVLVEEICRKILKSTSTPTTTEEIGKYWWNSFSKTFYSSYGANFRTQREIEILSLEDTISFFNSFENPRELSEILFNHWQAPQLFEDTNVFLNSITTPKIILSNIDRNDIQSAINHNGLSFDNLITSEDVKSYKPRLDMFQQALKAYKLNPLEVLHVGDSLSSDVAGAQNAGVKVAWINRKNKVLPANYSPDYIINSLQELIALL